MSCGYSKEILALYIEDDLPTLEAVQKVDSHLSACPECRQYCEQLRRSQSFIRSQFRPVPQGSVSQEMLAAVRRNVMSHVDAAQRSAGWAVRLERFLLLGFRKQRYAVVGFAFVAVVSVSLLGQIRHSPAKADRARAVFVGKNTLLCPTGYREWVFLGCPSSEGHSDGPRNVYINPDAHREYVRSGKFPDGTVMVLEKLSSEKALIGLEVSVKDSSRFDGGGWGFYEFTQDQGKLKSDAESLPNSAGCIACHRDKAATDHVFTQSYPVFRGIGS